MLFGGFDNGVQWFLVVLRKKSNIFLGKASNKIEVGSHDPVGCFMLNVHAGGPPRFTP